MHTTGVNPDLITERQKMGTYKGIIVVLLDPVPMLPKLMAW